MPGLMNYFEELSNMDWTTVVIFTCKNSCSTNQGYIEEYAYMEIDEDDLGLELKLEEG